MPILMKKFLSKHSQLLLTLVFGICVFIFWRMRYPFALTFNYDKGTVTTFAGSGTQIRSGKYELQDWGKGARTIASVDGSQSAWALGKLHTDAGSILFPFKINGGGEKPTDFEIMQLDSEHIKLIYAAPGTGGWGEATWWAFKKK